MPSQPNHEKEDDRRIVVQKNGPYMVYGNVPVVHKEQVVSELGEPLTWKKDETLKSGHPFGLCRCGQSGHKPFCDASHIDVGFDGTETATTTPTSERQMVHEEGTQFIFKRDFALCMSSGFCGTARASYEELVEQTSNSDTRSQVIAMTERCPSGSLTYALKTDKKDIEPDLPKGIAITTEITSEGAINGPMWVTGGIPVQRSDGKPLETRNRVTLCNCGRSQCKPLCDGTHRNGK